MVEKFDEMHTDIVLINAENCMVIDRLPIKGTYIKAKEIRQTNDGKTFHICYNDNGQFYMRVFNKNGKILKEDVNFNKLLKLKDYTVGINGFSDPFITSDFISEDHIFVNLFDTLTFTHYHFIYAVREQQLISNPIEFPMPEEPKNFPYKTFYNNAEHEIYIIYRHAQIFTVKLDDIKEDMKGTNYPPWYDL